MSVTVLVTQARSSLPGGMPWVELPRFLVRSFQFSLAIRSPFSTLRFNFRTTNKASDWPARNGPKRKEVVAQRRRCPVRPLLKFRHFADEAASRGASIHFATTVYEWRPQCPTNVAGRWESRFRQTIGID